MASPVPHSRWPVDNSDETMSATCFTALRLVETLQPRAVMLENVRGLLDPKFDDYRRHILHELQRWASAASGGCSKLSDFGVPQLRPRSILVAAEEYSLSLRGPSLPDSLPRASARRWATSCPKEDGWEPPSGRPMHRPSRRLCRRLQEARRPGSRLRHVPDGRGLNWASKAAPSLIHRLPHITRGCRG